MRYIFALMVLFVATTFAAEPIALFNGKDFTGWKFDLVDGEPGEGWSVKDGLLTTEGKPIGVIRTEKEYSNYELVIEWRWSGEPGNSGLLIHCSDPRFVNETWPKSIESQLMHKNAGDIFMVGETIESDTEAKGRRIANLTDDSEKPAGQWNTMKVRAEGDKVIIWVNGTLVNKGEKCSVTKGAISLQSEGAPIQFRKVELTPL